ncbi:hypothetical protein ACC861_37535 [Rhizobium ruizarguesonis]
MSVAVQVRRTRLQLSQELWVMFYSFFVDYYVSSMTGAVKE